MHARQELQARQGMTLAPKLQQSVKLLQMSSLELQQAIRHALDTNPFLEESEDAHEQETGNQVQVSPDQDASYLAASPADNRPDGHPDHVDAAAAQAAYPGDYPRPQVRSGSDMAEREVMTLSLHERLFRALGSLHLSERDRILAAYLIDSLDPDGYLRISLDEIAGDDIQPEPELSEWRTALHHIQNLLAPGIGARDLRECLLLQLREHKNRAPIEHEHIYALATGLVDKHLARLARNDWAGLLRALKTDGASLQAAFDLVRALDPKPGLRYDVRPVQYVIPDVIVDKTGGHWRVRLNRASMPQARLHRQYAEWLNGCTTGAERAPLVQELQEAQWLIRNIEQRYATIRRVAEAIVVRQRRFLDYGDVALRPLMLREIADDLEVHESTVSRATANKYMITPRGIFEFRHFFSRELSTRTGGKCSANAVRALVQEMISGEDSSRPLSDVEISRQLARHGIVVARRTVSKYRSQMHIPAVELRRAHA